MKQKKNLYFLVPAVLFIWGVIIYRIIDFTSEGDVNFVPKTYTASFRDNQENEPYQLKASYPDPFLKELNKTGTYDPAEGEITAVDTQPQKSAAPEWSEDIKYRGYINESGTDTKIALLVIEGKEVFLKTGDKHEVYVIGSIQTDSLAIFFGDEERWVWRE